MSICEYGYSVYLLSFTEPLVSVQASLIFTQMHVY